MGEPNLLISAPYRAIHSWERRRVCAIMYFLTCSFVPGMWRRVTGEDTGRPAVLSLPRGIRNGRLGPYPFRE